MTRVFDEKGASVPATIVQAGPCPVLQVKTQATDGYEAVQLGFDKSKPSRATLPQIGHAKKANAAAQRFIREVRLTEPTERKAGDVIDVKVFSEAEVKFVDVIGVSIGKGFQGVVKRWHFAGQEASHGVERKHRSSGGIGAEGSRGGGRAVKLGKKMAGHMGAAQCTIRNQKLISVDAERHLMVIKGAIPGPDGGYVLVRKATTKK